MRLFRFGLLFVLCFALAGVQGFRGGVRQATSPKPPPATQDPRALEYDRLFEQGMAARAKGDWNAAEPLFQKCLALAVELKDEKRQGDSLNRLGNRYFDGAQYDKALDYFTRSLAIREKLGNQTDTSDILHNIGLVHATRSQHDKALDYHTRSLALRERTGDQPRIAHSLSNIGLAYSSLHQSGKALDYLSRSLTMREKIGDRQGTADSINNIGLAYDNLGEYDKALDCYTRSLAISEKLGHQQGVIRSLGNVGNIYARLGQYERALTYHTRSLTIAQKVGDQQVIAGALGNIGADYSSLGQRDRALVYLTRSLAIYEDLRDEIGTATCLDNLGNIYYSLGRYDKALDWYTRSLTIGERLGNKQGISRSLNGIGIIHYFLGRYDKALNSYTRALAVEEEIGNQNAAADCLSNIGVVCRETGDEDKALDYHTRSLAIREKIGDRVDVANSLQNLGGVCFSNGQYDKALEYFTRSLTILEETGDQRELARCLSSIGGAYDSLRRYDNANEAYQRAMGLYEGLSLQVGDASELGSFQSANQGPLYERYAALQVKRGRPAEALTLADGGRAKGLSRQLSLLKTALSSFLSAEEAKRLESAQDAAVTAATALRMTQQKLEAARESDKPLLKRAATEQKAKLSEAESKYVLLKDSLLAKSEGLKDIFGRAEASDSAKELLQLGTRYPGTLFLEYALFDDKALVFALDWKSGLAALEFPLKDKDLKRAVADYLAAVQASEEDELKFAKKLYAMVIAPLKRAKLLGSSHKQIAIVADGRLLEVPFAALADEKGTRLIEECPVSNLVSLSTLLWRNKASEPTENLLAVADTIGQGGEILTSAGRDGFSPLPEARKEGIRAGETFPNSKCLIGEECRESAIKDEMARYSLLHFACHGTVNSKLPMRSALAMAPEKTDSKDDGFLEAREIVGLPLSAQLAVLSACHTGEGLQSGGEGLMGLAWAFRAAGVPAIVASKWEVDDAATGRMMATFYDELKRGSRKDDALRTAMLKEMRYPQVTGKPRSATAVGATAGKRSNAYYWAAFQVIGDCKPLDRLPKK